MSIDTACSSSLVGVHVARTGLAGGETSAALAAGVNLLLDFTATACLERAGAIAPDGRCKSLDAAADGYVRSEAAVALVLRAFSTTTLGLGRADPPSRSWAPR